MKSSLLLARFALPFVGKREEGSEGRTSTRTAFTDSYYAAYRGGDDVTVTGMKAKEHLGEREDERRNSTNVSSDSDCLNQ